MESLRRLRSPPRPAGTMSSASPRSAISTVPPSSSSQRCRASAGNAIWPRSDTRNWAILMGSGYKITRSCHKVALECLNRERKPRLQPWGERVRGVAPRLSHPLRRVSLMSHRYRLYPSPVQELACLRHCADARYVWNLALEQANCYRPHRGPTPGAAARQRQWAEARQETWLGEGSSSVQQQALRDFDRALANWWGGTHRRPTWRKAGVNQGFCVRDVAVGKINRRWAGLAVPKLGKVRYRLSRPLPSSYGMARITLDRAGRWHVSFSAVQAATERRPPGAALGIDRGVATTIATSDGEMFRAPTTEPGVEGGPTP